MNTINPKPRVLVVGWDGATWTLIEPLLAQKQLPNLARLIAHGSRADLRSCIQPSSEQAWSAFATGKQNGKFGLYGFYQRAAKSYALEYINASHRRAPTLWHILSERGKKSLVVNMPLTFPVEKINGALISGLMTPGEHAQFTYPASLRDDLRRALGEYIIDVDIERGETDTRSLGDLVTRVKRMSELQTRATLFLAREHPDWDVLILVQRAPDILCHKFWRYQDPAHPLYTRADADRYGSVIADAYRYLDAQLGELLALADENTSIVVLSDHGFGALTHAVYLNKYLAENNLLGYEGSAPNPLRLALRAAVNKLSNPLINSLKSRAFELFPQLKGNLHYSMAYGNIDWARTRAYAVGTMGNVYLNVRGREPQGIVEPRDYETTRETVIGAMRELRDPETGKEIFDAVYRREEIYHGPALEAAPDVVGLIDGPYHVAAVDWRADTKRREIIERLGDELLFVSDTSGQHRMTGILIAAGANIRADARFTAMPNLMDLAPTVLALLGEAIPADFDGRVLSEMFAEARAVEFSAAASETQAASDGYSEEEAKAIEARLAGLGYLG
jgi:predicted AlkP superfamily phosphohydrolase/phosphomutase